VKFKVLEQRAKPKPHVEIGVHIHLVAGKHALLGARPATNTVVSFENRDPHASARKISGKRQPVVACADYDAVEIRHSTLT
jgi:hypothetical protein